MAESESSLKKIIIAVHSGLVIAWLTFSTCFFGMVVITAALISHHLAYLVGKFWGGSLLRSRLRSRNQPGAHTDFRFPYYS